MKPCHNGGKCQGQEIPPYYRCECDSMWAGTECEIKGAFFQLNVKSGADSRKGVPGVRPP